MRLTIIKEITGEEVFSMIYDVAIVGAGPAGLMAAKTAAEKGLNIFKVNP